MYVGTGVTPVPMWRKSLLRIQLTWMYICSATKPAPSNGPPDNGLCLVSRRRLGARFEQRRALVCSNSHQRSSQSWSNLPGQPRVPVALRVLCSAGGSCSSCLCSPGPVLSRGVPGQDRGAPPDSTSISASCSRSSWPSSGRPSASSPCSTAVADGVGVHAEFAPGGGRAASHSARRRGSSAGACRFRVEPGQARQLPRDKRPSSASVVGEQRDDLDVGVPRDQLIVAVDHRDPLRRERLLYGCAENRRDPCRAAQSQRVDRPAPSVPPRRCAVLRSAVHRSGSMPIAPGSWTAYSVSGAPRAPPRSPVPVTRADRALHGSLLESQTQARCEFVELVPEHPAGAVDARLLAGDERFDQFLAARVGPAHP